jgi:hypothetical protein
MPKTASLMIAFSAADPAERVVMSDIALVVKLITTSLDARQGAKFLSFKHEFNKVPHTSREIKIFFILKLNLVKH